MEAPTLESAPFNLSLQIPPTFEKEIKLIDDSESDLNDRPRKKVNTKLYKTNLCRTFTKQGFCPYGMKCQFAHGESELRPIPNEEHDTQKVEDAFGLSSTMATPLASPAPSLFSLAAASPAVANSFSKSSDCGENIIKINLSDLEYAESPSLAIASNVLFSAASANDKLEIISPRIAMLNLSSTILGETAASSLDESQSLPEGAKIDCDPQLYKTELCRAFSKDGFCRYNSKCQFAHGLEELRANPNASQKILRLQKGSSTTTARYVGSTNSSYSFATNDISKENKSDSNGDLRADRFSVMRSRETASPTGRAINSITPKTLVKDPRVYKTELCKKFQETGDCPYGTKCQFAHGNHELRARMPLSVAEHTRYSEAELSEDQKKERELDMDQNLANDKAAANELASPRNAGPDPRLYKTELCRSFNRTGYCRYGLKCQFAHGLNELRPSPRLMSAALKLQNLHLQLNSPAGNQNVNCESPDEVRTSLSELEVLKDATYKPSSPKNLKGSPVIQSPTNKNDSVIEEVGDFPRKLGTSSMQAFSFNNPLSPKHSTILQVSVSNTKES